MRLTPPSTRSTCKPALAKAVSCPQYLLFSYSNKIPNLRLSISSPEHRFSLSVFSATSCGKMTKFWPITSVGEWCGDFWDVFLNKSAFFSSSFLILGMHMWWLEFLGPRSWSQRIMMAHFWDGGTENWKSRACTTMGPILYGLCTKLNYIPYCYII